MNLEKKLNKDSASDFWNGITILKENIKKDYSRGTSYEDGIKRFNEGVRVKIGRKFTKVICGSSVWGFIANGDGAHKGIPYFKGDVFKAAGWAAPAKHVRGSIFSSETNWFSWTGPRYLI